MTTALLDLDIVGPYLETHLAGFKGLYAAKKFPDGQSNPTFLLSAASGQYVLRRQPPGELLSSAHAVDREYRVIAALAESDVPVPRALHLCEDRALLGSMFYVMSYEQGRIFWDPSLPGLDKAARAAIFDEMNRVLASLHDVDVSAVGLEDYGRPGNYFARQVARWSKQYQASETQSIAAMNVLMEWLPANIPADDGASSLIHGDYRLDNLIFHADHCSILALLDWELSTLGHPYADLAYQCTQLRLPADSMIAGLGGLDRAALGIPEEEEYVGAYCERRGLSGIAHWNFYLIFSLFRIAAILQGVLKRALDGNASSPKALEYGAFTPALAAMAVELIERD